MRGLGTMFLFLVAGVLVVAPAGPGRADEGAEPKSLFSTVDYTHGEVALQGYLARPARGQAHPAVLIVHAWRGHGEFVQGVARDLAERGYVAFALDMYGKGVMAKDNGEARALATPFYADPALMRARARAGLEILRDHEQVDPLRIAAIGFCFGGTTVLELVRDQAPLRGVVSFHGGLKTKAQATGEGPWPRVLVCHGGDDPFVPAADVVGLWEEMRGVGADYEIQILADAVHAFTDPAAGEDPSKGAAYSASATRHAWQRAHAFLRETTKSVR